MIAGEMARIAEFRAAHGGIGKFRASPDSGSSSRMSMGSCLPWFAVYVKPRHEKNVALALEGKGHDTLVPTYSHRVKYNKRFDLPLFPGYVLCRIDLANRLPVLTTPGVLFIVGMGPEPEPISEQELQQIVRLTESGLMPKPWPYVAAGQEISLESGPLQGVQGVIVDADDEKWLVVSVNLLRRSVAVKIDREFVSYRVVSGHSARLRTRALSMNSHKHAAPVETPEA